MHTTGSIKDELWTVSILDVNMPGYIKTQALCHTNRFVEGETVTYYCELFWLKDLEDVTLVKRVLVDI